MIQRYKAKADADIKKKKPKKGKKGKRKHTGKWLWKGVPPPDGTPKQKTFETKVYHWCSHHEEWTLHTDQECSLGHTDPDGHRPHTAAAAAAIMDDDDNPFLDEEEDDDN